MSKVGDALGFSEGMAEEPLPEDPMAADDTLAAPEPNADAEILAMKAFESAKTPEAKVAALKGFLEACGVMAY